MAAPAESSSAASTAPAIWKHIGLHLHSVGTLKADSTGIHWKSGVMGGGEDEVSTSRFVPARSMKSAQWTVFGRFGYVRLQTKAGDGKDGDSSVPHEMRFDGFPHTDYEKLRDVLRKFYDLELARHSMSSAGASFGNVDIANGNVVYRQCILEDAEEEGEEFEPRDGEEMLSMDLHEVSQCVLPGNNRNEIELQFHESDTVEAGTDQLVSIRFYIPPDPEMDPSDNDAATAAEQFQQRIMKMAKIKNSTGSVIVEFDEARGTFLTPRGRYSIELYDTYMRMRGNKYDYKIRFDDISRLFLLPKADEVHMAFVIALDKPIRQGQQRYQHLVLQTTKEQAEVTINLDEKTLEKEYNGELQPVMYGSLSNLVAKTFKIIAKKKVFIPGKFANANQQACVKCALRASEGHLYPLEKQFIFIHKPTVLVRFEEVESVEFQRYAGGQGSTRNFDLCVTLLRSATDGSGTKEYIFSGIDRSDYAGLYNFLNGKKIKIKNLQGGTEDGIGESLFSRGVSEAAAAVAAAAAADDGEESSEDDDYGTGDEDDEEDSGSDDDDDLEGSDVDDSDLEEFRREARKGDKKAEKKDSEKGDKKGSDKGDKKAEKKRPAASKDDDDEDDDDDDGDKKQPAKKKKKESEKDDGKKKKKKKDPNAPKRPMTSFMYYSTEKRPEIKAKNPDASFGDMAKLIGAEFKKLSAEDKKKYDKMAEDDKLRYNREMKEYQSKGGPKSDGG